MKCFLKNTARWTVPKRTGRSRRVGDIKKSCFPDFTGKRMLDLGCGYGWHCIYAMEHGAASAVGIDISRKMLEVAREKTPYPQVEYRCTAMEDMEFRRRASTLPSAPWHFIILNPFDKIAKKVNTFLKPGAVSCFQWSIRFYGPWDPGLVLRRGWGDSAFSGGQLLLRG